MRVLAFDSASNRTGWAVFDNVGRGPVLVEFGAIQVSKHWGIGKKLFTLDEEIDELLSKYQPKYVAIEKVHVGKFANAALAIGKVVGTIERQAHNWDCKTVYLEANKVRRLIGNKAKRGKHKEETQRIVNEKFDLELTTETEDEADAIALGWVSFTEIRKQKGKK